MEFLILIFPFSILWMTCLAAEESFCNKGFQVAARYHDCWEQAKFDHKYPAVYEPQEILNATFLEKYAIHMCSVVKPDALGCFKKDVNSCPNRAKLIGIANESGGACKGKSLSSFFKKHVLDHLIPVPVNRKSPCFSIGEGAYRECYIAAGRKVIENRKSDEISRFHKVADLLFDSYWTCLIDAYKSKSHMCPNWQIPMLLVLQKTALPNLFGMLLTPDQVQKLELEPPQPLDINSTTTTTKPGKDCEKKEHGKLYLLMKVLSKRPSQGATSDGGIVVELSNLDGEKPTLVRNTAQNDHDTELADFLNLLSGPTSESSLKERRRKRKQEEKKNKALENLTRKLKGEDVKKTKKTKRTRKTKRRRKGKKRVSKKEKQNIIENEMIQ